MKTKTPLRTRLLAAATVFAIATPGIAAAAEKLSVRLDLYPWGIHAAMHLAKQKKWFDEAGLDVDVQDGTGTIATLQMVAAGHVDVGQVQLGNMAIAAEGGLDLVSFAGFARKGDLAVMVDAKSDAKTARDLANKKLVTFATSPWAPFVKPYFKTAGADGSNVSMVSPTAMISTYASGNADGFMSLAPFGVPLTEKMRPSRAILLNDVGIAFPSFGLVTRPETLAKRKETLTKFAQIQQRTWEYIYAGHIDEAVDAIIAQRPNAKLDRTVLHEQIVQYRPFFDSPSGKNLRFGLQSDEDWQQAIKSMKDAGALKTGLQPGQYYTNDLLLK
ncbi:Myristoyl transferase [Burkholderiales bacterium 8X]|nr:Myristoyl transferase [Burkholderiales bacterium 8X]